MNFQLLLRAMVNCLLFNYTYVATIQMEMSDCQISPDHSERAFYKELKKVIEASDIILEVLDARDPLGTRSVDLENMVLKSDPNKRIVLLLNKIGIFCLLSRFMFLF